MNILGKDIPALTISQPFAELICTGEKCVENRTWETLYHGPLAIHAGKGTQYLSRRELAGYPTGCVVAVAGHVGAVKALDV
jgi:activating signal cointegrator 1